MAVASEDKVIVGGQHGEKFHKWFVAPILRIDTSNKSSPNFIIRSVSDDPPAWRWTDCILLGCRIVPISNLVRCGTF